jgi:hypothetical protein
VSPDLAVAIDVARELAWYPVCNSTCKRSSWYARRREAHVELGDRLARIRIPATASPQLRTLVTAMRRVAAASFSNRQGVAYYERRTAVLQLRGCLDEYSRRVAA